MLEGLDFSRCSTLDEFLTRVEVILLQAGAVHNHTCLTRRRAMRLVCASKKTWSYSLNEDDKILIIANAVFPLHCVNFYALKTALHPKASSNSLDTDQKNSLATALREKKHTALILFLGL